MKILRDQMQLRDRAMAGNKAATLAMLMDAGFDVPPFFVVAVNEETGDPGDSRIRIEIDLATKSICDLDHLVAVRSSSVEEDGESSSFAGQFETFLHVERKDIWPYAIRVADSASSAHIDAYRRSRGAGPAPRRPMVLVQRMVRADTAGVAFAADPVSGDTSIAIVAATTGTGESLVDGSVQGDTWHVDSDARILSSDIQADMPVLTSRQVKQVASLVREVSRVAGRPQDIEWAFEGARLFLLQSRNITALSKTKPAEACALWDNSNIVESYGGVTTPLTFSVARFAYQEAYRHMGRALGIGERAIRENARAYEQMIGLIQGRVYYNLLNWYRLLMLTPGFRFNGRFMEQMMGVTEGLPDEAVPVAEHTGPLAKLRAGAGLLRVANRLVCKMFVHNSRVKKFHRELDNALRPADLQSLPLEQLIDAYDSLQARVIPAWDTPLINDLYCMMFHGALRHLTERWLDDDLAGIYNDLVAGEPGIVSIEPVRRMKALAGIAVGNDRFVAALCEGSIDDIRAAIRSAPEFLRGYSEYLEKFGDRCLDELKLESATLNDDPLPLLRGIGQLARSGNVLPADDAMGALRRAAEARIATAFRGRVIRKRVYRLVLRLARARIRDRENLRFERTRVYGRVRSIFVEIGRRLVAAGVVARVDDVFYLDVTEIAGLIRGTGISASVSHIVDNRRSEFAEYNQADGPPRRFVTVGPPQLPTSMQEPSTSGGERNDDRRQGQACSPGIVRGPVRIVRDPHESGLKSGEILVAQRTDPGWVTLFPLVTGMIIERGSLLSHSAIVSRELGIPAVVGVDDACNWLKDGDWVELNGATGAISRIAAARKAA